MSCFSLDMPQLASGPVPLNYGIEEARKQVERQRDPALTGPVYRSASLRWHPERSRRATVRRRRACWPGTEKKPKTEDSPKGADIATGIVKFLVDVVDETGDTVAIATILTMVKKLIQN